MSRMRAALRWLVRAILGLWAVFTALSLVYAVLHQDMSPLPQTPAIVVISGPGGGLNPITSDTAERVTRGIALWSDGQAPIVVMSGSGSYVGQNAVPDSTRMRAFAEARGLPAEAIVEEGRSHSTLQNAVFTAELSEIDPTQPIILVTNRFHMARSVASFWWAGFETVIPVTADDSATGNPLRYGVEGLKWLVNITRAGVVTLALALDVPKETAVLWLE